MRNVLFFRCEVEEEEEEEEGEPKGKKWRNNFLLYFANVKFTFILHYD